MNHYRIIAITLILGLFAACSSQPDQTSESETNSEVSSSTLPKTFYKKFTGTIGDIPVTMDLFRNDTSLTGTYYYNKIGMPLYLDGKIKDDGSFNLSEHNARWDETGLFSGKISAESIEGNWNTPDKKKSLPLQLTVATDHAAGLEEIRKHSENCAVADKNKKEGGGEGNYWDTLCTTMDLSMIQVKLADASLEDKINALLEKTMCAMAGKYPNLDALMKCVNEAEADYGFERDMFCALMTNDQDMLCIRMSMYEYSFGAAHPNGYSAFINIDLKTGKEININNILKPGSEQKLNKIGEKKFYADNGSEGWDFEPGIFELSKDVAVMPGGLLYQFDAYEIGPYAAGSPEVFIPYSEIKELLVPDSPVQVFVK